MVATALFFGVYLLLFYFQFHNVVVHYEAETDVGTLLGDDLEAFGEVNLVSVEIIAVYGEVNGVH